MYKQSMIFLAMTLLLVLSGLAQAGGNGYGQECFRVCISLDPNDRHTIPGKDDHETCEISCQVSMPRPKLEMRLDELKGNANVYQRGNTRLDQRILLGSIQYRK